MPAAAVAVALGGMPGLAARAETPKDVQKVEKLPGGYVRVTTAAYSVEVPEDWKVGEETSFGERSFTGDAGARMTAMTAAGAGKQEWERLYKTSLFYIRPGEGEKATPYTVAKTAQGYESASFSVLNKDGFARARYVLLKSPAGALLALSVKVPAREDEAKLIPAFERMVRTAVLR